MTQKTKRNFMIVGLCVVVMLMIAGYAAYTSVLNIDGTASMARNWDIRITNVESDIHGLASNKEEPTWDELTATFKAILKSPGDYINYDITVTNKGTIPAKLAKINMSKSRNKIISFTASGLKEGDTLPGGKSEVLTIKVEYNKGITEKPDDLVADLTVSVDYVEDQTGTEPTPSVPDRYLLQYDYHTNGGDSTDAFSSYQEEGYEANLEYTAEKKGYDFIGWNNEKEAHDKIDSYQVKPEENILYAIYKKDFTITYSKEGEVTNIGEESKECSIYNKEECEITLPSIEVPRGYEGAWYQEDKEIGKANDKVKFTEATQLTAKATRVDYQGPTITIEPNGSGEEYFTGGKEIKIKIEDLGSGLKEKQKVYYAFTNDNNTSPEYTETLITTNNNGEDSTIVTIPASVSENFNGIYYLWIKEDIEDVLSNKSTETISKAYKFDTKEISLTLSTKSTSKTITVTANPVTGSKIVKYEYNIDNTDEWVTKLGEEENTHTFNDIKKNTSHDIKVRITNEAGKTVMSSANETTLNFDKPTYTSEGSERQTVNITFPEGCGSTYTCTYQIDKGEEKIVEGTTATEEFTKNGNIVSKVTDGFNEESSTFTVTIWKEASGTGEHYDCPEGYTKEGEGSATTCRVYTTRQSSTSCYCSYGYTGSSSCSGTCSKKETTYGSPSYPYGCPNGTSPRGSAECTGGLIGGMCIYPSGICTGLVGVPTCDEGGTLVGNQCEYTTTKTTPKQSSTSYYCPGGYTQSGSGSGMKCYKSIDYIHTIDYHCDEGWRLDGDKCYLE